MQKTMMTWMGALCVGVIALAGCQKKHEDAAPVMPETSAPAAQSEAPGQPISNASPSALPGTDDSSSDDVILPSDQSDDMSNMSDSDAAAPSKLPDSQSGTLEDAH